MSLDHSDELGFPAEPTKVVRRNVPVHLWAHKRTVSNAVLPVEEHGWLTPLRKSAGDGQYWFWRCRCGDEKTLRKAVDVRKSIKHGSTPRCVACDLANRRKPSGKGGEP